MPHKYLLKEFEDFARPATRPDALMQHISQRIHMHIPRYNWVGFYLLAQKEPATLVLGPHAGSFTPNTKISLTQRLCGAAASTGRVIAADNVAEDLRYLQASDLVKSQISAPVISGGKVVGVFNVESYFMSTFKRAEEREFVEACAAIVARCLDTSMVPELANA